MLWMRLVLSGAHKPATTFVQLVGVSHPSPAKAAEFRSIDLVAGSEAIAAAVFAGIQHLIYVSVAHPAPMMKAYIAVRAECEALIRESGLNATILRPWYVLGPGHRWPYASGSGVLVTGAHLPCHTRGCAAPGAGYVRADASGSDRCRRIARDRSTRSGRAEIRGAAPTQAFGAVSAR